MKIKRVTFELWKKRLLFSFLLLIIFAVPYTYFVTSFFVVTSYTFEGIEDRYIPDITNNLQKKILEKSFIILPRNHILTYSRTKLRDVVVTTLPNSKIVRISPKGMHTLHIYVENYEPVLKIDSTHAITKEGVLYQEIKDISSLVTLVLATSTTENIEKGGIVSKKILGLHEEKIERIITLSTQVTSVIFTVAKIEITEYGDILFYDERGMSKIMFSGVTDSTTVWSNLLSAIDTDPLKTKLQKNKDMLEYLDARFGNKVFYKFTNDVKVPVLENHATTTATTTISQ